MIVIVEYSVSRASTVELNYLCVRWVWDNENENCSWGMHFIVNCYSYWCFCLFPLQSYADLKPTVCGREQEALSSRVEGHVSLSRAIRKASMWSACKHLQGICGHIHQDQFSLIIMLLLLIIIIVTLALPWLATSTPPLLLSVIA